MQADESKGIVRDSPRVAIPEIAVYDAADFLLHQPGVAIKRGGTSYAGPALSGASYTKSVFYAPFAGGDQIVALGSDNHLYKVTSGTTTDKGAAVATVDQMKFWTSGTTEYVLLANSNGTSAPGKYDGSAAPGTLSGSPPGGKYMTFYKTRLCLGGSSAQPQRVYFSPTPNIESTWDTTNSWIDFDHKISGLAATSNMLLVFSNGAMERVIGSTPPPDSDMDRAPIGNVGCTDARSIVVQEGNVLFANPRGVYLTNGAGFASLTDEGLIATYWQGLFSGYDPTSWTMAAGVFRGRFYFITILDGSRNLIASLMCDVPRRAWTRLTNIKGLTYSSAQGASDELYYADAAAARVTGLSGLFSPSSSNKNDADGTAVTPLLEYRALGQGPGMKAFGFGHLTFDMRDSASDNPTMAVSVAAGLEATSYSAVAESPFSETSDATRKRFMLGKDGQVVNIKLQQSNASSKTEVYALEVEARPYQLEADGP